jgi:hypothetical protein
LRRSGTRLLVLDGTGGPGLAGAVTLAGAVGVLVGVALPWLKMTTSPVTPTPAGYETIYGVLAGVVALVVLVAAVTDRAERRWTVALLGGAIVVPLAAVPLVALEGRRPPAIGLYVALASGLLTVLGGVLGR